MPRLNKRKQQQKDAREAAAKKQQQQKDDEAEAAAAAPSAAREARANKPLLGRPPERKDAAPRVRRSDDRITCDDAASAGLQKPLGERPHKEPEQLDPEGRKSQAGQKRKQLPEQGQIKQGKGKQRGSLLADCLERAETECTEVLAGLDQGSSALDGNAATAKPGPGKPRSISDFFCCAPSSTASASPASASKSPRPSASGSVAAPTMTPGLRLQNALLKPASKKRKNKEVVADLDTGKGRLAREGDGDISVYALEQNEPYWSIRVGEKKCACHPHTGLQYACKALTLWRRLQHADCNCDCANCGGRPDSEEHRKFFAATADCSALGDLVSCAHEATTGIRPLECMLHHDHWLAKFAACPAEEESSDSLPPVKFLKSEPVQHKKAWAAQNEWVHDELNFVEFVDWMHTLYDNVYKLCSRERHRENTAKGP